MSPADQQILRNLQRSTVETWADLVVTLRPESGAGQARFAVYAALAVTIDSGRLVHYRNSPYTRALAAGLLDLTLLGRYRLRTVLPAKWTAYPSRPARPNPRVLRPASARPIAVSRLPLV